VADGVSRQRITDEVVTILAKDLTLAWYNFKAATHPHPEDDDNKEDATVARMAPETVAYNGCVTELEEAEHKSEKILEEAIVDELCQVVGEQGANCVTPPKTRTSQSPRSTEVWFNNTPTVSTFYPDYDDDVFQVGDQVEGLLSDGHWYRARIQTVHENGTFTLAFDNEALSSPPLPSKRVRHAITNENLKENYRSSVDSSASAEEPFSKRSSFNEPARFHFLSEQSLQAAEPVEVAAAEPTEVANVQRDDRTSASQSDKRPKRTNSLSAEARRQSVSRLLQMPARRASQRPTSASRKNSVSSVKAAPKVASSSRRKMT